MWERGRGGVGVCRGRYSFSSNVPKCLPDVQLYLI